MEGRRMAVVAVVIITKRFNSTTKPVRLSRLRNFRDERPGKIMGPIIEADELTLG